MNRIPAIWRQRGFSLVEVMVALTISLLLLAGIMQVYIGSKQVYRSNEALARMQAQGRFGIDLLAREVRHAGLQPGADRMGSSFFSWERVPCSGKGNCDLDILQSGFIRNALNCVNATGDPDPTLDDCDVLNQLGFLRNNIAAIQGFDPAGGANNSWTPPTLNPARLANADVIAIATQSDSIEITAHPGGSPPGSANVHVDPDDIECPAICEPQPAGTICIETGTIVTAITEDREAGAIFQVSAGNADTSGTVVHNTGNTVQPGNRTNGLGRTFEGGFLTTSGGLTIYYLAANATGRGSLYRRFNGCTFELVDGIQDMQITYGEDTDNDRQVDVYRTADAVTDWADVLSVRISLLVESQDTNVTDVPQTLTFNGATVDTSDRRLRQVFTTTVAVRNRLP